MKRLACLISLLFLSQSGAFAQTTDSTKIKTHLLAHQEFKWIFKHSLSSWVDLSPSVQFAAERHLAKRWGTQLEAGWFVNFYQQPRIEHRTGGRIRAEARFYPEGAFMRNNAMSYAALEVFGRYLSETQLGIFSRYGDRYREAIEYDRVRQNVGIHFKGGAVYRLGNSPLVVEIGFGIGVRGLYEQNKGLPADAETYDDPNRREWFGGSRRELNRWYLFPSGVASVKIGYALWR